MLKPIVLLDDNKIVFITKEKGLVVYSIYKEKFKILKKTNMKIIDILIFEK